MMRDNYEWFDPADEPVLAKMRADLLAIAAEPVFGKRRGMPLPLNDERTAALTQVYYRGEHRGVAS